MKLSIPFCIMNLDTGSALTDHENKRNYNIRCLSFTDEILTKRTRNTFNGGLFTLPICKIFL